MTFYDMLKQKLWERKRSGETDRDLGKIAGVSHSYINILANGPADNFRKVKFETLVKLFPDVFEMIMRQSGQTAIANASGSVAINGNNNVVGTIAAEKQRLASEVLDDDKMCAECKVRVLQMLKK